MTEEQTEQISDEEALMKIVQAMKDNQNTPDEKHNVHTFLNNVVLAPDPTRVGNLKCDKERDELGKPIYTVRGDLDMALISKKIMNNSFFEDYFIEDSKNTLSSSLSREGFLVRQATVQTKNIADVTRKRKVNKGMFGKQNIEESGGDPFVSN